MAAGGGKQNDLARAVPGTRPSHVDVFLPTYDTRVSQATGAIFAGGFFVDQVRQTQIP
jgi:hypothetical protein